MNIFLKLFFKTLLPKKIFSRLADVFNIHFDRYGLKSYSQEGEDMILKRFFENQKAGFYVDVGAHHPTKFSNTYFFYKTGWHGINIDAMPGSMNLFRRFRPRDINIEKPISDRKQTLTYYAFNEPALNGFSEELSNSRDGLGEYRLIFKKDLETSTLESILDAYLPNNQIIDFLTVDVEGLDLMVLKSNNWKKYSPRYVLAEVLGISLAELGNAEISLFMKKMGYDIVAKSMNTVFFKKVVDI